MTIAITRKVSPRLSECEITHIDRLPIDIDIARAQHQGYVSALASLGCQVVELPEETEFPDSVFVEDTAIILPELAVITRPGADSRKGEVDTIIQALSPHLPLLRVREPATLDGGDVLVLGKNIYVGISTRSNAASVHQLQEMLKDRGYVVCAVEMHGCLHLKTAVTKVDEATVLINPSWLDHSHFKEFEWIEIDPTELFAANCLPIAGAIIYPTAFPKTQQRLEAMGHRVVGVNLDELAKAEGAVTCCSLIL
jgi:dimethylargininase